MQLSQEKRILNYLKENQGEWVSKEYFIREMMFTQAGRALHNLQKHSERYDVQGLVEVSKHTNEYGFKYWRFLPETQPML